MTKRTVHLVTVFLEGRPLRDNKLDARYYLERGRVMQRLQRAVDGHYNTLLLGERGSGKTSELGQLAFRLRAAGRPLAFVDVSLATSPLAVVELIRTELGRASTIAEAWRRSLRAAFVPTPALSVDSQLLEAVRALGAEDLDEPPDGPAYIIVDGMATVELAHTLFGRLRDEFWRLPYVWIVSGDVAHETSLLAPPADAFFDVVLRLPPLTLAEAQQLVAMRRDDGDDAMVDVSGLIGAWADTPRDVLRMFREAQMEDRSVAEVQGDQQRLEQRARELGRSAEMAYTELRAIARPVSASDQEFLSRLSWTRPRAVKVLKELEAAGLARSNTATPDGSGRPRVLYVPVTEVFR